MNEHDYEPIPGLPALLPKDEMVLWQGAPDWKSFAARALWIRWLIGYFAIVTVWVFADQLAAGKPVAAVLLSTAELGGLGAVAIGLMLVFAWLVARTTLYTITTRRLVMRIGVALSMTIQIPFRMVDAASVNVGRDGSGDIALALRGGQRVAYLILWPHARPWRLAKSQPALRGLRDAASVARILARALAASASQPAKVVKIEVSTPGAEAHAPVTA